MAVVIGTNAGFVSAAPSADPAASGYGLDANQIATIDTSPAGSNQVTEIGFYQSSGGNDVGAYSMGVYSHDAGNDRPNALIATQESGQSTTASTAAWYKYTGMTLAITASTSYWLAVGMTDTTNSNNIDYGGSGKFRDKDTVESAPNYLSDPWGVSSHDYSVIAAIYAKYEAAGGSVPSPRTNIQGPLVGSLGGPI